MEMTREKKKEEGGSKYVIVRQRDAMNVLRDIYNLANTPCVKIL